MTVICYRYGIPPGFYFARPGFVHSPDKGIISIEKTGKPVLLPAGHSKQMSGTRFSVDRVPLSGNVETA
jgi:hypothetical protein